MAINTRHSCQACSANYILPGVATAFSCLLIGLGDELTSNLSDSQDRPSKKKKTKQKKTRNRGYHASESMNSIPIFCYITSGLVVFYISYISLFERKKGMRRLFGPKFLCFPKTQYSSQLQHIYKYTYTH